MIFMNTWSLVLLFFSGVLLVFRSDATSVPNISIVSRLNFTSDVTILLDNTFNKSNGATISDHDNEKKIIKRDAVVHEYSTEENVNFHIELGFYGYCKLSLFIIIRIFFGIAIDGSKFKEIIKRPIGLAIAVFCNFLLIPLLSYGLGWVFYADRFIKRLDFFQSGYRLDLHTFVFEPGYVLFAQKRFIVLTLSNCLTVLLGGNIELSLVTSTITTFLSQYIKYERYFMLFERIFNGNQTKDQVLLFELDTYNYLWPLCFSIIFSIIGVLIQCAWPQSKKYAVTALRRISVLYILNYFFIMIGFVLLVTFTFKNSLYSPSSFVSFLIDMIHYLLPMVGFIVAYIAAKVFKQTPDKCIAIAVESTILNFLLDMTLLPLAACSTSNICRRRRERESSDLSHDDDICNELRHTLDSADV